jgi:hypothetical protein
MKFLAVMISLFIVGCAPRWGDYWSLDAEVLDSTRETSTSEPESPYIFDDVVNADAVISD